MNEWSTVLSVLCRVAFGGREAWCCWFFSFFFFFFLLVCTDHWIDDVFSMDLCRCSFHLIYFPSLCLFFFCIFSLVSFCFLVYQIEMAIETLQKTEGLSSQRSSLLNSHVSWKYKWRLYFAPLFFLHFLNCFCTKVVELCSFLLSVISLDKGLYLCVVFQVMGHHGYF